MSICTIEKEKYGQMEGEKVNYQLNICSMR